MVQNGSSRVFGYQFDGYWRDVGTIESYYDGNMDLLRGPAGAEPVRPGDAHPHARHRATRRRRSAGARTSQRSLLDLGCIINGHVEHSVLSPGVFVEEGAVVRDSIIFDDCRIEAGAIVERSIIDKEVRGRQERLRRLRRRLDAEQRAARTS